MAEPQKQSETTYVDYIGEGGLPVPLKINTHTLVAAEQLRANIAANLARPIPRLLERMRDCPLQTVPLAIIGAGPSLRRTLPALRKFKGPILACGSVHDYLVRNGIIPTYAAVCDGSKEDKGNLLLPQPETVYWIASQCDPGLFDHLEGHNVEMFHYRGQATPDLHEEAILLNGEPSMGWGGTVMLISMCIAMLLKYQYLEFFGLDSSYEDYGLAYHCTDIAGAYEYRKVPVKVNGREFISDLSLLEQASQWWRLVEGHRTILECTIHGNGLIAEMVKGAEAGMERFVKVVE